MGDTLNALGGRSTVGGVSVQIDPYVWSKLKVRLDAFDPALTRALRRSIRGAGDRAVGKVQARLRLAAPSGGPNTGRGRAALVAATRVSVSFSKRSAGAKIVTSAKGLPERHSALLKVYNKASFRHPVFGDLDTWVSQQGRPYFGSVIAGEIRAYIAQDIHDSIDDALKAIGATHV